MDGSCILYNQPGHREEDVIQMYVSSQMINLSKYKCLLKVILADYGFKGASLINIKENQCTHII